MSSAHLSIPKTSPTRYLSGIVALNILSDRGTGDWHQDIFTQPPSTPPRSFIIEKGTDVDPIGLLGTNGIYDASGMLDAMHVPHPDGPVYAASHARAIADLVLSAVLRGESPDFVGLDDWMPRDEDKSEVLCLLDEAAQHLELQHVDPIEAWVERNGGTLHRRE
jgi:hypothetical protein